jgi:hypothetical protein
VGHFQAKLKICLGDGACMCYVWKSLAVILCLLAELLLAHTMLLSKIWEA